MNEFLQLLFEGLSLGASYRKWYRPPTTMPKMPWATTMVATRNAIMKKKKTK